VNDLLARPRFALLKSTSRLRLDRAAAELVHGTRSVLAIALDSGFVSHEAFSRAFLRRFAMTPGAYRARGMVGAGFRVRSGATLPKSTSPGA
jgi:AraC-like DNA-binding protein